MVKEPNLRPVNNHVLVELGDHYSNIAVPEGKYDTRTNGVVLHIEFDKAHAWAVDLLHRKVYWQEFKEGTRVEKDGKLYAFIKLEDVEGFEADEQTSTPDSSRRRATSKD
jgi:co-chaperonin GroES (HSP10)